MAISSSQNNTNDYLASCAKAGVVADFSSRTNKTLSAAFLRTLVIDRIISPGVAPAGFAIRGASIDSDVDFRGLGSVSSPLPPLNLFECTLSGLLDLRDSCWISISLNRCSLQRFYGQQLRVVNGFSAENIHLGLSTPSRFQLGRAIVGGDLRLTNLGRASASASDSAHPEISIGLYGAHISGNLQCGGCQLAKGDDDEALTADGIRVEGGVFLSPSAGHEFDAKGEVRFYGATIGRSLTCTGALFDNAKGFSLNATNAHIGGDVNFRPSAKRRAVLRGTLGLHGASVSGNLSLSGAELSHELYALDITNATIRDDVYLSSTKEHKFEAKGSMILRRTKIGGRLDLSGASIASSEGYALDAMNAEIVGDAVFRGVYEHPCSVLGRIRLHSAKIGGNVEFIGAALNASGKVAVVAAASQIGGSLLLNSSDDQRFVAQGGLDFFGVHIGGSIHSKGALLECLSGRAFNVSNAVIRGDVTFNASKKHQFTAMGRIVFHGAQIGGNLDFQGAHLEVKDGSALQAINIKVGDDLFLNSAKEHRFESKGQISLAGARIGGSMDFSGALIDGLGGRAVDAMNIECKGDVLLNASHGNPFQAHGNVSFHTAKITGNLDLIGASLKNSGGDALVASNCEVGGVISLRSDAKHRFSADGCVRLFNTKVVGNLECSGALLENATGYALNAESIEVGGSARLGSDDNHQFHARGTVRFFAAKIGRNLNLSGAHIERPNGEALQATNAHVGGDVFLRSEAKRQFVSSGTINLNGAQLDGDFDLSGASIQGGERGLALIGRRLQVGGDVILTRRQGFRFEAFGGIWLPAIRISGDLDCTGAFLDNISNHSDDAGKRRALSLPRAQIDGNVRLDSNSDQCFEARGEVRFATSIVGRTLSCDGASLSNPRGRALNLRNANVAGALILRIDSNSSGTPSPMSAGTIELAGCRVAELDDDGGSGWGTAMSETNVDQPRSGLLLRLDGFSYERLAPPRSGPRASTQKRLDSVKRIVGLATGSELWHRRCTWLERQYQGGKPSIGHFRPQPYEQLAKVLRLMGHGHDARRVAIRQLSHEARCGAVHPISRYFLSPIFRYGFGFGYSPNLAFITVASWWIFGWLCLSVAIDQKNIFVKSLAPTEIVRDLSIAGSEPKSSPPIHSLDRFKDGEWIYSSLPEIKSRDIPCTEVSALLYALDTLLPVVDLHQEDKCEISAEAYGWRWGKAFYAICGWIIVALAALTWTGVLRRNPT